ncbi:helix-turn-helix transcriptional regulator [Sphingomonas jeddahensis]|uniref:HTH luxR-type domain-containing protein n=1 Tax=Sphingomonas jeddahensis TaxID=1915074 RepID=A0A1V2EWF9_9SPHN|nr:hypothetical protein [Sphingomonas jeddahensis]ONF96509.1 hypothetical protein SPHI_12940 [Sphingomonas jeddahensis]
MAIGRSDETDLLLPLHEGIHEQRPWTMFLQRLRQRVRADVAGILIKDDAGTTQWLAVPEGSEVPTGLEPLRQRPERVYAVEENRFARVVRVDAAGGGHAWLLIQRAGRDFTAADGALIGRLAPHLAIALRTRVALERRDRAAAAAAGGLKRVGIGWVAFAEDGRLLSLSEQAETVLGARHMAFGGITSLVRKCMTTGQLELVPLGQAPVTWMLLLPVEPVRGVASTPMRVLGLIRVPHEGSEAEQAEALMAMFGLTRSEARLASAVAGGASLAEAADSLGLTIETARNYAKRVFAKTRTRGQVDLVRTMAGSVAGLA